MGDNSYDVVEVHTRHLIAIWRWTERLESPTGGLPKRLVLNATRSQDNGTLITLSVVELAIGKFVDKITN